MSVDYKQIGKKIKELRLENGLSQEQLAEYCGLSPSYVSYIETGKRRISLKKLEVMSQHLHFNVNIMPKQKNDSLLKLLHTCSKTEKVFLKTLLNMINNEL